MKLFKTLFDFYINSSIHVGLAVFAMVRITELYYNLPYNEALNYVFLFGTITGYNFIKYAGIAKLYHSSLTKNLKIIQVFSLFCFLLLLYYLSLLSLENILYLIPIGVFTLLYAIPVFVGFTKNLRNIPVVKIWVIALVWTMSTVFLPLLAVKEAIGFKTVLLGIQRFLFVVVLTLPFDIRDFRFDKRDLKTIPQLVGVARTKKIGFIFLVITLVIEFYITPSTTHKSIFLLTFLTLLFFLQRAETKQSKYYASFWVEAIPIFWGVLLFLIIQ